MNKVTIIILVCVVVAAVAAITAIIIAKKRGKPISSCCGDCSSCGDNCPYKNKEEK